jgi:hypothetical protein
MASAGDRDLEQALEEAFGERRARTLIGRLVPEGQELALRTDVAMLEARFDRLEARFDGLGERIDAMRIAVEARLDGMDAKIEGLRSEFVGLRTEVDGKLEHYFARSIYATVVAMVTVVALVLTAGGVL